MLIVKVFSKMQTRALFESKKEDEMFYLNGGMVEERYNEITIKMRLLDKDLLKESIS
jgi:hypothetical protein